MFVTYGVCIRNLETPSPAVDKNVYFDFRELMQLLVNSKKKTKFALSLSDLSEIKTFASFCVVVTALICRLKLLLPLPTLRNEAGHHT